MIIWAKDLMRAGLATRVAAERFAPHLEEACGEFKINTTRRLALFLAQCAHESVKFTRTEENLNYSAQRLLQVFGKYFNPQLAAEYSRNPRAIANRVYANRMGNGDELSGDGWKYRGRGLIQLTGKDNYEAFWPSCNPDSIALPPLAARSAAWFWAKHGCNELADAGKIDDISATINAGDRYAHHRVNGLIPRRLLSKKSLEVFDARKI